MTPGHLLLGVERYTGQIDVTPPVVEDATGLVHSIAHQLEEDVLSLRVLVGCPLGRLEQELCLVTGDLTMPPSGQSRSELPGHSYVPHIPMSPTIGHAILCLR
jgi:hypothetical protein